MAEGSLHFGQQTKNRFPLRNAKNGFENGEELLAILPRELDQILQMNHTQYMIDRVLVDRDARVASLEHLLDQLGDRCFDRIGLDLGSRNHDLGDIHLCGV